MEQKVGDQITDIIGSKIRQQADREEDMDQDEIEADREQKESRTGREGKDAKHWEEEEKEEYSDPDLPAGNTARAASVCSIR